MTWGRFGYICRKTSADCQGQESVSECLSRIESEESCEFYGARIAENSWPRRILNEIESIENKSEALDAIEIYKNLNLTKNFEVPMRFKRVISYLSYIILVFYAVAGIYQLKVAPTFISALENIELSVPAHLMLYQNYLGFFILLMSAFLITSLLIGFRLKKLFSFGLGVEKSLIVKFLIFRSIRESYSRVLNILQFPILSYVQPDNQSSSPVTDHLQGAKNSKMCVATEMRELLNSEMRSLVDGCERQMKYISVAVALMVVAAIFVFLVGVYSPIFILGETV